VAKSVIHRKRGCENEQTDPLDGRTQVEDKLRQERAVSLSDPQTERLGKRRPEAIDGNLDRRCTWWSRIACEPLLPRQAPMRSLSAWERCRHGDGWWIAWSLHR